MSRMMEDKGLESQVPYDLNALEEMDPSLGKLLNPMGWIVTLQT